MELRVINNNQIKTLRIPDEIHYVSVHYRSKIVPLIIALHDCLNVPDLVDILYHHVQLFQGFSFIVCIFPLLFHLQEIPGSEALFFLCGFQRVCLTK